MTCVILSVVSSFVVVGVHLRSKKALEEMNNLVKVYDDMAAALHTQVASLYIFYPTPPHVPLSLDPPVNVKTALPA